MKETTVRMFDVVFWPTVMQAGIFVDTLRLFMQHGQFSMADYDIINRKFAKYACAQDHVVMFTIVY